MADLGLVVQVDRTSLGKPYLDINDYLNYYVTPDFLGAANSWQRNKVASPYLDGDVTTWRTADQPQELLTVEVLGGDPAEFQENLSALIEAFTQDNFEMTVGYNGLLELYLCEASDFKVLQTGPRWIAMQGQVTFTVPRRPRRTVDYGTILDDPVYGIIRITPARGTTVTGPTAGILVIDPVDITVTVGTHNDLLLTKD